MSNVSIYANGKAAAQAGRGRAAPDAIDAPLSAYQKRLWLCGFDTALTEAGK